MLTQAKQFGFTHLCDVMYSCTMSLLCYVLTVLLWLPFLIADLSCTQNPKMYQDPKQIINDRLFSLLETRNTFLKSSELQKEEAILKYKKTVRDSNFTNYAQIEYVQKKVFIEECGCHRQIQSGKIEDTQSLCSEHASLRGQGQKVVAFSYYGDANSEKHKIRQYLSGIKTNLEAIKKFYPGKVYICAYSLIIIPLTKKRLML